MGHRRFTPRGVLPLLCGLLLWMGAPPATAQDAAPAATPELELHIDLTRQFQDALRRAEAEQRGHLSTESSQHYLEQIAISTRFMVETNLRLLREQAEIKALLERLLEAAADRRNTD